ncbi:unnamed protein product [Paramecium pentaurelia]|uniref:Protein kinase domain-containing protein n=1 Tax=Paramecium pentaurelia TaxID=43138 RepID=A0A8S1W875_9CILI|nr:unnamed protein product [Paramecium pentaurelia]
MEERIVIENKYEYWKHQRLVIAAFTEIYLGKNISTQEDLAFKIIKKSNYNEAIYQFTKKQGKILMVLAEASKIDICPFIVKIQECLELSNNLIYIVMEYCNQGSLSNYIQKEKQLQENEALYIMYQLLQALVLMAKNNIVHRNIKPQNIFIKDGVYKLGGFGMAEQNSKYEIKAGTLLYMAPEIFTDDSYDQKVDVWSLGLVIHEILFGELYFQGINKENIQLNILTKQYDLDGKKYAISNEFKDLLRQMIHKDPKQRLTAEDALKFEIFNQFRTDPRYIKIMENEKLFEADRLQKYNQQNQIEEDQIQKQ